MARGQVINTERGMQGSCPCMEGSGACSYVVPRDNSLSLTDNFACTHQSLNLLRLWEILDKRHSHKMPLAKIGGMREGGVLSSVLSNTIPRVVS